MKHQLSYSLPIARLHPVGDAQSGVGDIALNYRYQLVGGSESKAAVAPRFTVLLPTGDSKKGLGAGGAGLQTNVALSLVLSEHWVTHWNAGITLVPSAKNADEDTARTLGVNLGQSTIWLASKTVNVLVETVWTRAQAVAGPGTTAASSLLVSPGLRWAYDFRSGLQIVPGVAFPIGLGPSRGERSLFLYLSFEHPFRKTTH